MEDGQRSERSLVASSDGRANSIQPKLNAIFGGICGLSVF